MINAKLSQPSIGDLRAMAPATVFALIIGKSGHSVQPVCSISRINSICNMVNQLHLDSSDSIDSKDSSDNKDCSDSKNINHSRNSNPAMSKSKSKSTSASLVGDPTLS